MRWSDVDSAVLRIARDRTEAEIEVLAAVIAAHPQGVVVAHMEYGVETGRFENDDLAAIFAACVVGCGATKRELLWLIRRALVMTENWSNAASRGGALGPTWNPQDLVRLVRMQFSSLPAVRMRCEKLNDIDRRQCEARDSVARLRMALAC